ncbi:hypothetical protein BDD14_6557 [Edaphobacter modestus]|uniref:Uncharacterized protein n=1 Tax=Edaphobacter modestus TaxID=388466 RepID=A0A4Q7XYW5_9BACT|nr:hypothetical protein BDD14_6557 [Edaphobacter modestus]
MQNLCRDSLVGFGLFWVPVPETSLAHVAVPISSTGPSIPPYPGAVRVYFVGELKFGNWCGYGLQLASQRS